MIYKDKTEGLFFTLGEKVNMARDYKLEYNDRSKKLKVWEKGELRLFRNISQEEYNRLANGLRNNPGSGYLHFNAFLNRNFDKEVGGEYDQAYAEYKASQYKDKEEKSDGWYDWEDE